jgi:hypothetical protein
MIVSFRNLDGKVQSANVDITTRHYLSLGQPVLVSSDGEVVDVTSWTGLGYKVVSATTKERYGLKKMGLIHTHVEPKYP